MSANSSRPVPNGGAAKNGPLGKPGLPGMSGAGGHGMPGQQSAAETRVKEAAQAMLVDATFEFKENAKAMLEKLEKKIPFQKIDIEHMQLDRMQKTSNSYNFSKQKGPNESRSHQEKAERSKHDADCPKGIMKDIDYKYCYQNLLIETKEWYQTIKNLTLYLQGQPNKAETVKQSKVKGSKGTKDSKKKDPNKESQKEKERVEQQKPRCMKLKETMDKKTKLQSFEVLNFSSEQNMADFMEFLTEHMSFTERMICFTIWIGDIVEQSIRHSNLEQFQKNAQEDEQKTQEYDRIKQQIAAQQKLQAKTEDPDGEMVRQGATPEDADSRQNPFNPDEKLTELHKKSSNYNYKFMSIDQLENFKLQYYKAVNQLIMRMYKSIFALYTLFPEFNDLGGSSIFDKAYQLQLVFHSFSQYRTDNLSELERMRIPKLFDFEIEAQTLLKDGGIKNKSVKTIYETSKVVTDKIDNLLEEVYLSHSLLPDFFICSKSFQMIWNASVISEYEPQDKFIFKVGLDVFKMALQNQVGGNQDGGLTAESFDLLKSFLPSEKEAFTSYEYIKLIDLINFTDFIDVSRMLGIYQQDQVLECLDQLKTEKSIVSELYNQNYTFQKHQNPQTFVTTGSGKHAQDFEGQAHDLIQINDLVRSSNLDPSAFSPQSYATSGFSAQSASRKARDVSRTLFLRTPRHIERGDFELFYFLNLFGIQYILNNELQYALHMKEKMEIDQMNAMDSEDPEPKRRYQNQVNRILRETEKHGYSNEEGQSNDDDEVPPEAPMHSEAKEGASAAPTTSNQQPENLNPASPQRATQQMQSSQGLQSPGQSPPQVETKLNETDDQTRTLEVSPGMRSNEEPVKTLTQKAPKPKRVQIVQESAASLSNAAGQSSNASEYQLLKGQKEQADLRYDDTNLLGLNSLLQVNEVNDHFEALNLQAPENSNASQDDDLGRYSSGVVASDLNILSQLPRSQLNLTDNYKMLKKSNNLGDIMNGQYNAAFQVLNAQKEKQIGQTFGDHEAMKENDEYSGFRQTDKGYLLQFEQANEAAFLTNNNIFQQIMQRQNFFNQDPEEPVGQTLRLDPTYPEKRPAAGLYDDYGFEIRKDVRLAYLPLFTPFSQLCAARRRGKVSKQEKLLPQRILEYYIFRDFSTFLHRPKLKEFLTHSGGVAPKLSMAKSASAPLLPSPDLNTLKQYMLGQQKLHHQQIREMELQEQQASTRSIISIRFQQIFTKLSQISIDGFQRERYMVRIQDLSNEIINAQEELQREEKMVEEGAAQQAALVAQQAAQGAQQSLAFPLSSHIQNITDLMLNIEKALREKLNMERKLKEKEQRWEQDDTKSKQRRIILNYIIRLNMDMNLDAEAYVQMANLRETARNLSGKAYELIFFMVSHILEQNRMPSINFMAEIDQYINSQKEELGELSKTQFELTSKVLAKEEEKREMRKKIDEMKQFFDLKDQKEQLQQEIAAQEVRIAQLRASLRSSKKGDGKDGKGESAAGPTSIYVPVMQQSSGQPGPGAKSAEK